MRAESRTKALVVEDSTIARSELRRCLGELCDVMEASHGADALNLARDARCDLVVVDINMPVMGGIELVRLLRGLPGYADVPIIVVTAESSDEQVQRGRAAGVNAWVVKPIDPDNLRQAVEVLLQSDRGSAA